MPESANNFADALAQVVQTGGALIAPARQASVASLIATQLMVEQAATKALPFELEPSAFQVVLHRGV